jgi:hypothetical protein
VKQVKLPFECLDISGIAPELFLQTIIVDALRHWTDGLGGPEHRLERNGVQSMRILMQKHSGKELKIPSYRQTG